MSKQVYAIASCRVSTPEQMQNNSLNRQREAVLKAAKELDAVIPEDYWWSGNVSSKKGGNVDRKDLKAMLQVCRKNKQIKYLIVDEPDRFMRSIDEAAYFEVLFRQLGVQIWYASDPELNKADLSSKLLKFTKYWRAEGSNDERIQKSLSGTLASLQAGRYPGPIKLGYKKGYVQGVQEIHETYGPVLKDILIDIASGRLEPTEALKKFNRSVIRSSKPPLKMDKFRTLITDPFYCKIVEINKQVIYRNENALHEPLISKEQHEKIVEVMSNKRKNQSGPRKGGNPLFPLNNIVTHDACINAQYPRIVGFPHTNGKNPNKVYMRYKCRGCGLTLRAEELHLQVQNIFEEIRLTTDGKEALMAALADVWKQEAKYLESEISKCRANIRSLNDLISKKVDAATDPSNSSIKEDILNSISRHKDELSEVQNNLSESEQNLKLDNERFFNFALTFLNDMDKNFFELSPENRLRCKQLLFPAGLRLSRDKKVYTPEISPLYRLETIKRGTEMPQMSCMVRVRGL